MFGRLKRVRLNAAENALKDGRLDEAFRLATAEDLGDDRRAGALRNRVAEALWARARRHYDAGRYSEALVDLERAGRAGYDHAQIVELSSEIRAAAHQSQYRKKQREDRLAAARQRIEDGSLLGGRRILAQASAQNEEARRLEHEAEARKRFAADELAEARKLMDQHQVAAAIQRFQRGAKLDAHSPEAKKLEADLCRRILDEAARDAKEGRVDRARERLTRLGELGRDEPQRRELEQIVDRASRTARLFAAGSYVEALGETRRLRHLLPEAKWLRQAEELLESMRQAHDSLAAGPLGLILPAEVSVRPGGKAEGEAKRAAPGIRVPVADRETLRAAPRPAEQPAGVGPELLLVLVDGAGSFLLTRKDRTTIGRVAGGAGPLAAGDRPLADVALLADLSSHHAEIARVEDDYFLFAAREAAVNDRPTQQKMLADGDRITLGRKVQLCFRVPSRKSVTAVLDLAGQMRLAHDVRRLILFIGHAMIGPGSHCHIRVPAARRELVLFERGGALYVRPFAARPEERFQQAAAIPVALGQHMEIEDIGLSFTAWPADVT